MVEIRSALDGLCEDMLAPDAQPMYDVCDDDSRPLSLTPNGGIQEHASGRSVLLELAAHTDEELERGARLLLLRAANRRRVLPDEVEVWFNHHCDLITQHILEIPEFLVGGGDYAIEQGDALLVLTEPMYLGLVVRKGNLSSILIFNPRGVVRIDPNAERLPPPPPPRRRWQPLPESRASKRARLQVERRAKSLLFQFLSREQKWELRAYRRVTVTGQDGRCYRIYAWQGMNVRLFDGERETHSLCVVAKPENPVPVLDLILAQKVLLENDVERFLATANTRVLR